MPEDYQEEILEVQGGLEAPFSVENEILASFLKDILVVWEQASQEKMNKLAGCLFE